MFHPRSRYSTTFINILLNQTTGAIWETDGEHAGAYGWGWGQVEKHPCHASGESQPAERTGMQKPIEM